MTTLHVTPETLADPRVQRLLGRSALYELLALALTYPEHETLRRIESLADDLAEHSIIERHGLGPALATLRAVLDRVDADRLAPVHFTLFEGSVLCSPHESEYIRDPFAKAAQLADIAGFYAAFGLKVSGQHLTTPDEICTELEFMALLTRKEAYALVRGWTEPEAIARGAGRRFLESHLGRWTGAFAADLCLRAGEAAALRDDEAVARWFHAVGDLLRMAVDAEVAGQRVYPSLLITRYADPDGDTLICPMAPEPEKPEHESLLGGSLNVIRPPDVTKDV